MQILCSSQFPSQSEAQPISRQCRNQASFSSSFLLKHSGLFHQSARHLQLAGQQQASLPLQAPPPPAPPPPPPNSKGWDLKVFATVMK